VSCLLCGDEQPLARRYAKGGFHIARCAACRLTQLDPLPPPEILDALYGHDYFENAANETGYDAYLDQEEEYLATFEEDLRRISEFVSAGRVLDVGCGFGFFMQQALDAGYDVYGSDVAEQAVKLAVERLPGRAFLGAVEDIVELQDAEFDVIFASHLIEHITTPVPFLENLVKRLRPGGICVLVTPNIDSLLARVSRARWVSFKVPEHVAYYSPRTIRDLFARAGLEMVAVDAAYQHYRVPFVAAKLRALTAPASRLVPPLERTALLRDRVIRVTSGSIRAIARKSALESPR
jgi:2-polyprenyl-3-methyl-5-hydroxy-6-metoxy-1,4-benzoquinol methylase